MPLYHLCNLPALAKCRLIANVYPAINHHYFNNPPHRLFFLPVNPRLFLNQPKMLEKDVKPRSTIDFKQERQMNKDEIKTFIDNGFKVDKMLLKVVGTETKQQAW